MKESFDKIKLESDIAKAISEWSFLEGAWFGGSRATQTEDIFSDTDLVVLSSNPEKFFQEFEIFLRESYPIEKVWKVEGSIFKNFSQRFYVITNTPEYFYLDVGVFTSTDSEDFREYFNHERHGCADIIFDRSDILKKAANNPKLEKVDSTLNENSKNQFEIIYRTFLKEALRNKYIDSVHFYQRLVTLYVAKLRRMYAPQKHDFGLRYVYKDLPYEQTKTIEEVLQAMQSLEKMQEKAKWMRSQVAID